MRTTPLAVALSLISLSSAPLLAAPQDPPQHEAATTERPAAAEASAGTTTAAVVEVVAAAPAKEDIPLLRPEGAYADLPEMGFSPFDLLSGGGGAPKSFYQFLTTVESLAKREETQVVVDLTGNAAFNMPQLRELERALAAVRAAGKRITCYLENADASVYQIAAQCDRVLLADMGGLDLRSPAMGVMHFKDALDLLGVQVEVTRVGAFKGAVEPYLLPTMSDHLRHHYETMLASINDDIVRRIASGRQLSPAKVRELQAQRLFTANDALQHGLVDKLVPWVGAQRALALVRGDEHFELVDAAPKKKKKQNRDLMSLLGNMLRQKKDDEEIEDPQVVVLHLAGQIVDGEKAVAGSMVSGDAVERIRKLTDNELVKGVVVRVNSPGGSATASEAIRLALQDLAAKKPVVFSMGELAASGGYWITTIGQPILAEASTITGSIGVFGMRFQTGALMRRLGVHTEMVRLDDGPLMDAMDRPWSDAARARMQGFVDDIYERFLANVGQSRNKTRDQIDAIAGGRVWSGQQAVELGLVDAIGGVADAVTRVRELAKLDGEVEVQHVPEGRNFAESLFDSLFESGVAAGADAGALRAVITECARFAELGALLREALAGDGRPKIYALMPPGLRVR